MDANRRLALIVLRHKLDVDRYGRGTLRDIYKVLKTSEDNLVREVAVRYEKIQSSGTDAGPAKTKAVEDLIEQTRAIAKVYEDRLNGTLTDNLIGLARNEYEATAKSLNAVGFLDVKPKVPEASKLASIVASTPFKSTPDRAHVLSSWTRHMSDDLSQKVEGLIRNGLVENKTVAEIARAIRGTKGMTGVMDISRRSAETLVRTAVATIQTDIALDSYRASGVVTHVRWQSVFDNRTSEICQARDGREWAIDDRGLQRPPAHPNCRSQLVPITAKFRDLGLDRDEAPEDDRDYEAYIKDAGEGIQNEVFGVKRAQLFRDGKITFRELFNNDDQYYTLDQLRARHPDAFEGSAARKPTAPVETPQPTPAPAPKGFNPRDPSLSLSTMAVRPLREVKAAFVQQSAEAAKDPRYIPRSVTRGIKDADLGKATLPTGLTDEAATLILNLKGEVDAITDAFNIPRLRGIRSVPTGTNHTMNMGEGTLGINPVFVNGYTGKVEIAGDYEKLNAQVQELATKIKAGLDRYGDDRAGFQREFGADYRRYRDLADKAFKLKQKVAKTADVAKTALSTWKVGDDPKLRPWTVEAYFDDPVDRMRALLYHETAHHVHDFFKNAGGWLNRREDGRLYTSQPRLITELAARFRKFTVGLSKSASDTKSGHFPSRYAEDSPLEWWAENFALYMLGKKELVEPELIELIEDMLKNARDN